MITSKAKKRTQFKKKPASFKEFSPFSLLKIISSVDLISHLQGEKSFRTKELFTLVENGINTHGWKVERINSNEKILQLVNKDRGL